MKFIRGGARQNANLTTFKQEATTTRSRVYTLALVMALVTLVMMFGPTQGNAFGVSVPSVNQCNGTDNVGGQEVSCRVAVVNNLDLATNVASSTVTVTECHGAANTRPTCTRSTTPYSQLTTSVTQCDGSGSGGGGTVLCEVDIVNNITGAATTTPATVNQCIGAGDGGGTQPTIVCNPLGSTTNATVTQCNGSGNGGGGTLRVRCTVSPSTQTSALPITVDQCNGSGNGGGSTVTCFVSLVNNITTVPPVIPPTITPPPVTPPVVIPPVTPPTITPPPVTPPVVTPVPVTPVVVPPAPVTPAPVTPAAAIPTPVRPAPVAPAPVTPVAATPPSALVPVPPAGVTPPTATVPPATPPMVPTGKLAFTGSGTATTALLALLLLALGTALVVVSEDRVRRLRKNAQSLNAQNRVIN
jgi:hypothetical protein